MTTPRDDARSARQPWPDRWLLDAFRDRGEEAVASLAPAPSAWEALEAAGVSTAIILQVVQEISGVAPVDVSALGTEQAGLLSLSLAQRYAVVPIRLAGRTLEVATANPLGNSCERDLAFACGRRVALRVASPAAIRAASDRVYGVKSVPTLHARLSWVTPQNVVAPAAAPTRGVAVDLLDQLVLDSLDQRASDIHFEPADGELLVRFRIDGVLHDITRVPADVTPLLLSRLKIGAGLDIANRLKPQDGRSSLIADGRPIDLRVSTLPLGERMEKAVVRILDASATSLDLVSLGFDQAERDQLAGILRANEGMVLVTGPTGSGKTTTLYAALRQTQSSETNIVTVEDPIEYRLEGVNQVQVNERAGLSFAAALRSILRQDPDVVLVGEVRDVETASIAIRASMTGHLVLSTLHTNDAASAIGRLADMGVDMSALAGALKAVIAQRLVRRLCTECKGSQRLEDTPAELQWVFKGRDTSRLCSPVGCSACRGTGYRGRMVIAEILVIDDETQQLMARSTQRLEFLQLARKGGMHTLWETGLERVLGGLISFAELIGTITPPIPDADLRQDDVDRLLADLMAPGSKPQPPSRPSAAIARVADDTADDTGTTDRLLPHARSTTHVMIPDGSSSLQPARAIAPAGVAHERMRIAPRIVDGGQPRVLVVHANPDQRREMRRALARVGCLVIEAANGDAALAYACRLRPDAVVTELALPGLDGMGLLQLLLAERVVEQVFIYTDQTDLPLLEWAKELGACDVLTTADDVDTLATLVRSELDVVSAGQRTLLAS